MNILNTQIQQNKYYNFCILNKIPCFYVEKIDIHNYKIVLNMYENRNLWKSEVKRLNNLSKRYILNKEKEQDMKYFKKNRVLGIFNSKIDFVLIVRNKDLRKIYYKILKILYWKPFNWENAYENTLKRKSEKRELNWKM